MKRTPGPWRIGDAGFTVFGPPNGNPSPETIATTKNSANASLMAAAPELLEALYELLAWQSTAPQKYIEAAHKAIAKAES